MDALTNYITALGYANHAPEYVKFWENADERMHFVGKEIIRFHCIVWPCMLHAAGLPVPTRVFAHGWLTRDGRKALAKEAEQWERLSNAISTIVGAA